MLFPLGIVCVILCLALVTSLRAWEWGNPLQLALTQTERHPASARAQHYLANVYVILDAHMEGDTTLDLAREHLRRAEVLDAYNQQALFGLIQVAFMRDEYPDRRTLESLNERLRSQPHNPSTANALERLVHCHIRGDCRLRPEDMMALFRNLLDNPTLNDARSVPIRAQLARYYLHVLQDAETASQIVSKLIDQRPDDLEQHINLIMIYIAAGAYADAQREITDTRKLIPPRDWLQGRDYHKELDVLAAAIPIQPL